MNATIPALFGAVLFTVASGAFAHNHPVRITTAQLAEAPVVDGDLQEWEPYRLLNEVALLLTSIDYDGPTPSTAATDWEPDARLVSGIFGDRIYIAMSWNDDLADTVYRPWQKIGSRFTRNRNRDDMAALRFHVSGDFNACMISGDTYSADVWRWTAGRSALAGIADDMSHHYSTTFAEAAAEYPYGDKTVYIRKVMDEGDAGWKNSKRPDKGSRETLIRSVETTGKPRGSRADVAAAARWADGRWTLELSRALETGDPADAVFRAGETLTGQIALFNAGYQMRKMVSTSLNFELPAAPE